MADTQNTERNSFIANINLLVQHLRFLQELNDKFPPSTIEALSLLEKSLSNLLLLVDRLDLLDAIAEDIPELQVIHDIIAALPDQIKAMTAELEELVQQATDNISDIKDEIDDAIEYWEDVEANLLPKLQELSSEIAGSIATHNNDAEAHAALFGTKIRTRLTAATTFYVRKDGNDSNNGLSAATAFLTVGRALTALSLTDHANFNTVLDIGPGTWGAINIYNTYTFNCPTLYVRGSGMSDCIISGSSGPGLHNHARGVVVDFRGFRVQGFDQSLHGQPFTATVFDQIDFGPATNAHIYFEQFTVMKSANNGSYKITGGARYHIAISYSSYMQMFGTYTVDIQNTPNFEAAFLAVLSQATFIKAATTYNGSATGQRITARALSLVSLAGAGINSLPGSSDGAIDEKAVVL